MCRREDVQLSANLLKIMEHCQILFSSKHIVVNLINITEFVTLPSPDLP